MLRTLLCAVSAGLLAAAPLGAADGKHAVKLANTPAPKELKEPIRQLLSDQSVQVLDDKGALVAEYWFRKELPTKATPAQAQKGLAYEHLEPSTLLGAVHLVQPWADFRKQKIKPGIYTFRFAIQPMDGDHMGTAPHPEFSLLCPADQDEKPDRLEVKALQELSTKASGTSHPAVVLFFPNPKPPLAPQLVDKGNNVMALSWKADATAGGQKAVLGIALTVFGHGE